MQFNKKKILFYIFDVNWRQGGTMVMHLFSKMLSDMGEEVYLTTTRTKRPDDKSKIISQEEAVAMAQNDDTVVVYPEVVFGNPLGAKNVVRWVLYYPGVIGGQTQYDSSELVLSFYDRYVKGTPYENSPLLTIIQTRLNQFFPMNMERRFDCILLKKGSSKFDEMKRTHLDPYLHLLNKEFIVLDHVIEKIQEVEQLNEIFNQVRYFISFDQATYYNIMASLAGCTSIVLPIDGLSKEKWSEEMPTYKYGVAYGFDDLEWSSKTRNDLISSLQQTEEENVFYAKKFIEIINTRFRRSYE